MVFYFTATGNSKYIADRIAAETGVQVKDMAECIQKGLFSFELEDDTTLGFVVPVYFRGIPMIVTEFLENLKVSTPRDLYSYAVLNCGGTTGDSERFIRRAIMVDAVFGIWYPGRRQLCVRVQRRK